MKMTLLDMVQDILSDMSGDAVNSIGDTEEALQIAQIIKSTYNEMMTRREWPHLKQLVALESYSNNLYPTYLILPKNTRRVEWITYNQRTFENPVDVFSPIKFMLPNEFIQWTNSRNTASDGVKVVKTPTGVSFKVLDNIPPTYFTSFDDKFVVMDSYEGMLEDTLQGANSQCEVYIYPDWYTEDGFIANLPGHLFPALLAEAKSACFYIIKQMANEKAEQQSKRQQNQMSMNGWKISGGVTYPNYGRRR